MDGAAEQHSTFRIYVDHGQFMMEDGAPAVEDDWDIPRTYEILERELLAPKPSGLVVATARMYGYTDIEVVVQSAAPNLTGEGWDHVAECGLHVQSGPITFVGPEETGEPGVIPLPPGSYRVAVFFGGLSAITDELDPVGSDHYRVVLWPGPATEPVVVHKRRTD